MTRAAPLLALLVASCLQARATPYRGPDGRDGWYHVQCRSADWCLVFAGDVCRHGYDVIGHNTHTGETTASTPVVRGEMTIRCRQASP